MVTRCGNYFPTVHLKTKYSHCLLEFKSEDSLPPSSLLEKAKLLILITVGENEAVLLIHLLKMMADLITNEMDPNLKYFRVNCSIYRILILER